MDRKVVFRLILFFIVLPLLIAVTFWDVYHHLPLFVLLASASVVGTIETSALFRKKGLNPSLGVSIAYGLFFPTLSYFEVAGWISIDVTFAAFGVAVMIVMIAHTFVQKEQQLEFALGKVSASLFALFYPGFFLYFLFKISSFSETGILLAIFALATFGNDANAWLFGNLFGRKSKKPFLVSPQKSVIGFVGGILGSFIVLVTSFYLFPGLLGTRLEPVIALSAAIAFTTIVGDLFESSLKRSAGVKDSGTVIPGRGGLLDSIDSLLFSAAVFFLFLTYGRF